MLDNNKNLIVVRNSIFKKLSNFFKKIFKIKEYNNIEENSSISNNDNHLENMSDTKVVNNDQIIENNNLINSNQIELVDMFTSEDENNFLKEGALDILNNSEYNSNFIEYKFKQDLDYNKEKEKIFDVYNDIKNGKTDIDELDNMTLIEINQMLKAEMDFKMCKNDKK